MAWQRRNAAIKPRHRTSDTRTLWQVFALSKANAHSSRRCIVDRAGARIAVFHEGEPEYYRLRTRCHLSTKLVSVDDPDVSEKSRSRRVHQQCDS